MDKYSASVCIYVNINANEMQLMLTIDLNMILFELNIFCSYLAPKSLAGCMLCWPVVEQVQ